MSDIDITKVLFYSDIDTFKNVIPDVTGTINIPSLSYSSGQTRTYTTTFSIDRLNAATQTMIRFSFANTRYYTTRTTVDVNAYFRATFSFVVNGSNMTLRILVWNADGSTRTSPAWSADYIVKKFAAPFN